MWNYQTKTWGIHTYEPVLESLSSSGRIWGTWAVCHLFIDFKSDLCSQQIVTLLGASYKFQLCYRSLNLYKGNGESWMRVSFLVHELRSQWQSRRKPGLRAAFGFACQESKDSPKFWQLFVIFHRSSNSLQQYGSSRSILVRKCKKNDGVLRSGCSSRTAFTPCSVPT